MSGTLAQLWPLSPSGLASKIFPPPWSSKPAGACSTHSAARSGPLTSPHPRSHARLRHGPQGAPSVNLIGGGSSAPDWAAFANGVHIRYFDCNDTYLSLEPAHPSDNWAAVMAAGQLAGADGKAWIAAAAVAYEVQCRLCDAASIRARGWDHTTYGSISATLAAAMLLKLTHEQTVHALGIAATTGTALRLTRAGELSMWKGCAFAFASRNAIFAALLAADGMTGPAPLFEGEMGFFQQVSGPVHAHASSAARRTAIGCSPRPRSSSSQPNTTVSQPSPRRSICAARSATRRTSATSRSPRSAPPSRSSARTPKNGARRPARQPTIAFPIARPSRSWTARSQPSSSPPSGCETPPCSTWSHAPASSKTPKLTAGYPAGIPNRVTVTLDDGRKLVAEVAFPPGHDRNPLTDEQLAVKFHELVDPVLGRHRASQILDRVSRLEHDPAPHETLKLTAKP